MYSYQTKTGENTRTKVVQPKLKIGQPGDKYEQEADAVAERVMRMSDSETMQMQPIEEEEEELMPKLRMQPLEEEEEMMQPKINHKNIGAMVTPKLEKFTISEEEKNGQVGGATAENADGNSGQNGEELNGKVQPKSETTGIEATPDFQNQLSLSKGGGNRLSDKTSQRMGSAINADFSNVRVHTDSKADKLNENIQSRAFTHGSDIYFKQGEYNPESSEGKNLLAHELTHTIQQGASPQLSNNAKINSPKSVSPKIQRAIDTSILLHTYSLNNLSNATGTSGNSTIDRNLRRIESSATSSFGSRNPVLNMNVKDTWYYYADSFAIGCPTEGTRSKAGAILQNCAWEYYAADDDYSITFTYRHTGTRQRQGTFATSSGRTTSQTVTLTGGAKLTYSIIELSASASSSSTSGSSSTTTVTSTNFFEHDYDVSIAYSVNYYQSSDFRIDSDFFPGMDQVGGSHSHSGTANIGSITVYDDDNNSDNLTP